MQKVCNSKKGEGVWDYKRDCAQAFSVTDLLALLRGMCDLLRVFRFFIDLMHTIPFVNKTNHALAGICYGSIHTHKPSVSITSKTLSVPASFAYIITPGYPGN